MNRRLVTAVAIITLFVIGGIAQLQQSGGTSAASAVSISQGGNTATVNASGQMAVAATQSGTWNVGQTGTWNVGQTGTWNVGLSTGTNTIGKVAPVTTCGTTAFGSAWAAVPTSNTAVTATTTCVTAIMLTNTNGSAQTVTITDGQGSPVTLVAAYSIPANSSVTFPFYGSPATTGVKWIAGGSGVTGSVVGVQ